MKPSRVALLVCAVLALMPASIAVARSRGPAAHTGVVIRSLNPDRARLGSFWTPARMNAALPLDVLQVSRADAVGGTTPPTHVTSALGTGGAAPTAPEGASLLSTKSAQTTASAPGTLAYPYSSGALPTSDYRTYPYSTIGRVFFTDPKTSLNYSCSGTALASDNQSVVWTAGHCVHGGGAGEAFYTNWVFVPSYVDHTRPAGTWGAVALLAPPEWVQNGNLRYDMAAAVVAPLGGRRLTDLIGGQGIQWNVARSQTFEPYGYPAAPPFDGERIHFCRADLAANGNPGGNGPATLGIGCDMTEGSSGGGWVVDGSFVNSDVSYGIEGQANVIYGPYFGDAAATLYETASTSTAGGPLPTPTGTPSPSPSAVTPPSGDVISPSVTKVIDKPDPFTPNRDGRNDKAKIYFSVSEQSTLTVTLYRPGGAPLGYLIRDLEEPPARYFVKWNGKDVRGRIVPPGKYHYVVSAIDGAGNEGVKRGALTVRR